ncbi:MAG: tRNA threonylcarbamoyladenosine dehydratase [Myxococcota bacterium]|nr:tRNA threonylcarbamoyladenosine dehydratase [Myxococcota bacterium]
MTIPFFERLALIVGPEVIARLARTRVILFGVGGVGSWCAEALIRNGVGQLTIVDPDEVSITNINRQLQAAPVHLGTPKVEVLAERLRQIHPDAEIRAMVSAYGPKTREVFKLDTYDYIIDAIDSLGNKVDLLATALATRAVVFTSLGASCKLDPTRVQTGSFWAVRGCPLGKHLRKRLRNRGVNAPFDCVFSNENLPRFETAAVRDNQESDVLPTPTADTGQAMSSAQKQINGSAVQVTAAFGFTLASLLVRDIVAKVQSPPPPSLRRGYRVSN